VDFVTHACVGAIAGRAAAPPGASAEATSRLARGAMALGALAALLPDGDHLLEAVSAEAYLVHHRSATHSLLFAGAAALLAATPSGGRLCARAGIPSGPARAGIVGAALASHLLLDVLTPFGTMLLHPFDARLFALDGLPIVAPLVMVLSILGLAFTARGERARPGASRGAALLALAALGAFLGAEIVVARAAAASVVGVLGREGGEEGARGAVPGAREGEGRAGAGEARVLLSVPTPLHPLAAHVYVRAGEDMRLFRVPTPGGAPEEVSARPRVRGPAFAESKATPRGAYVARLEMREPPATWLARFRVPVANIAQDGSIVWTDLQFEAFSAEGHRPLEVRAAAHPIDGPLEGDGPTLSVHENPRGPQIALWAGVVALALLVARRAGALTAEPTRLARLAPALALLVSAVAGCAEDGGAAVAPGSSAGAPTTSGTTSVPNAAPVATTSSGAAVFPSVPFPSDDPNDWMVDTSRTYDPVISPPLWVSPGGALPPQVHPLASNNNVGIVFHDGRLFLAFRTSETHFASSNARIYVLSSGDMGLTWTYETEVAMGTDVREPCFLSLPGTLVFHWFEAGSNPVAFEPRNMWRIVYQGPGSWSAPQTWGRPGEIPWDMKVRGRRGWLTSYRGGHYNLSGPAGIEVHFQATTDGLNWFAVDPANPVVYTGGVSEVAFEFDEQGDLWAVTRNEDGDGTGFGAHVATAPASDLGRWAFPARSDPERYDSPEMFRHGDDLYLVARRDLGGPFDMGLTSLSFEAQRAVYLAAYSARPKRTTLYAIDRVARRPVPIVDLPSCGDTALPSVARTGPHTFLVANYTSPLGNPDRTWIHGQLSPQGTQVYLVTITFAPR
jgi:membrane-bound metal-dependent hydrolase YbcI (DUF457 family)